MKSKKWLTGYFCIVLVLLGVIGVMIYEIDPYFHYHYPHTEEYYYELSNERYQNDGIMKHFDYDAVITGTSMTEQFKTSELDALFGTQSIKIPYSGATYKEIHDSLKTALRYQPELKMVVWGLDMNKFLLHRDEMRYEPKEYPTYLYNENLLDDVNYFFNRDTVLQIGYGLINNHLGIEEPGMTSFDEYAAWQDQFSWGIHTVCPDGITSREQDEADRYLSDEEKLIIQENVEANVTSLAKEYPNVTFYYFFTPYSALWWHGLGSVHHQIAAEQYVIEMLLECDNIRLYSFNNRTDITTDLNHYKDELHYAAWINSLMLKWMHDGEYLLTKKNYMDYLEKERVFYTEFDYESLNEQEDYGCDYYAAALLNQELRGVEFLNLTTLLKELTTNMEMVDGLEISVQDIDAYQYLTFYGRHVENGQVLAEIFDEQGEVVSELVTGDTVDENLEWHQYLLDISEVEGDVTIRFNGRVVDGEETGNELDCADVVLKDVFLY